MKKIFIALTLVLTGVTLAFGQAKKPTLMVVPSDAWCNKNGYMMEFDNQGTKVKIPDYKKAMQEDTDLLLVIASINDMMAERGFPLKNIESAIKTLESNAAEYNMRMSKDGALAGIITGATTVLLWIYLPVTINGSSLSSIVYEIIPGFIVCTLTILIVSKFTYKASNEIDVTFDKVKELHQ